MTIAEQHFGDDQSLSSAREARIGKASVRRLNLLALKRESSKSSIPLEDSLFGAGQSSDLLPPLLVRADADDKLPAKTTEPKSDIERAKDDLRKLAVEQRSRRYYGASDIEFAITDKEFKEYQRVGRGGSHGSISSDLADKYRDTNFESSYRGSKDFTYDFLRSVPQGKQPFDQWCKLAGENSSSGRFARYLAYDQLFGCRWDALRFGRQGEDARPLHAGMLRDLAGPGNHARDLTEFCVRDGFMAMPLRVNDGSVEILIDGLKQLTKPERAGDKPPLTEEQRIIIMRLKLKNFAEAPGEQLGQTLTDKELPANPQLAIIRELAKTRDLGSVPVFQALLKNSPCESVRQACAVALSDFGPFPSKLWPETVADPTLAPSDRAKMVETALDDADRRASDKYPPKFGRPNDVLGSAVAWAIADAYKVPAALRTITDSNDPGLKVLERALDCKHIGARLAAAKVLGDSALGFDHPTRKKAAEVLVNAILDPNLGTEAKKEAIAILDVSLRGHAVVDVGKYKLSKTKDALIAEDSSFLYTWTDDGKIEKKERERKIPVGGKFASITIGINTVDLKYIDESRIVARTGTFDGTELTKLRWVETGKNGPEEFVATRKKEGNNYVDEWVVRVPDEKSGLTRDIDVKGRFDLSKDGGKYSYVGEDWTKEGPNRLTLHQNQEITGKGVTEYRD